LKSSEWYALPIKHLIDTISTFHTRQNLKTTDRLKLMKDGAQTEMLLSADNNARKCFNYKRLKCCIIIILRKCLKG